ncbi:uncharacterized protein BKA55DRAFT_192899 [Fusarium redolens]|uniref:Uncharacterized protein n=1 Tax=Fusarium redolens TaxID=48865 RepID=A0A9P9G418_FUSRE|nr:uncharacterized protein BKA55DRAFT_192899 [Fusarium redolens]KAH7231632.1 hypothetical protein BKA55DRAFT_192899 [Fusarium redolens]
MTITTTASNLQSETCSAIHPYVLLSTYRLLVCQVCGFAYSSIPNCRVPLIVAYPCSLLKCLSISGLFPYAHTMATYLSRFDRRPGGALLTRVNAYLSFLTSSTLPTVIFIRDLF